MERDKRDDSRPQGHGPDDLEPLDEHTEERQEPEDDYYIRNYVLKEASESGAGESDDAKSGDDAAADSDSASVAEAEVAVEVSEEFVEEEAEDAMVAASVRSDVAAPPAFGSQTFGPAKTERMEVREPEPEDEPAEDFTRADVLATTLNDLLQSSSEIHAAALVSLDGLAMASALPDDMMEDRVAAMSAAILGLGERASTELGQGSLNQVFVEGDDGYVFLMSAGGKAVLTALAGGDAKVGLVFYDMKHAAARIADVL